MSDPLLFPNTAAALAAGRAIGMTWGVVLEFATETLTLWRGLGTLNAGGRVWSGLGEMGDVARMEVGVNAAPTEPVELVLSGLRPDLVARYAIQQTELAGRRARVFLITTDENEAVLDAPVCVRSARMDRARRELDTDKQLWTFRLFCEPLTVGKHRPAFSWITHADQIRRWPGDMCLERIGLTAGNYTVVW